MSADDTNYVSACYSKHTPAYYKQAGYLRFLPPPTQVRDAAAESNDPRAQRRTRPPPVRFPTLGLIVKYGTEVTTAEAECLLFVRRVLQDRVPVPQVYSWCVDDGQTFIYMELLDGITLEAAWPGYSHQSRVTLCQDLRDMIDLWRNPANTGPSAFIGHIGERPLLDIIFASSYSPTAGPFTSVSAFHDWFTTSYGPAEKELDRSPHSYRPELPDNVDIVFTHADLHPSNIIVSPDEPKIIGIIDWHQSGWYPAYWEYCKARWTSHIGQEWEREYIPQFLDPEQCYDFWDYFVLARGV